MYLFSVSNSRVLVPLEQALAVAACPLSIYVPLSLISPLFPNVTFPVSHPHALPWGR